MSQANLDVVKNIYSAFGKGDLPTVVKNCTPQSTWFISGPPIIPYSGHHCHHQGVERCLYLIAQCVDIEEFNPQEFFDQQDTILVLGRERMRVKSTGNTFATDWVHVWKFLDGKVHEFREVWDSAAVAKAFEKSGKEF